MMNFEIVKKQIIKACKNLGISYTEEIKVFVDFFRWYYAKYEKYFKREHKRLTTESIENVINNILSFDEIMGDDNGLEVLKELAEQYFTCEFSHGTDYSISHFGCYEILQNRIYETMI